MEVKNSPPNEIFAERSLASGGMVEFDSRSGAYLVVFGRSPMTSYGEGERPPVEIDRGILPIKLLGTTARDTSRQQFGIERRGNGPFLLINYSKQPLDLDGVSEGKRELAPGMATEISQDAQGMQRVKIGWMGGCEVSVQAMGASSNDKEWHIGFLWKRPSP
jgi:hypothetical protein